MPNELRKIQYLNTDLDLVAACDLTPLSDALNALGVFPLTVHQGDDGLCYARFEINADAEPDEPETTIRIMLDAIEALNADAQSLWRDCAEREFNIGYDCGDEPWAFNNGLSSALLARMAKVGVSLRITIYPQRPPANSDRCAQ